MNTPREFCDPLRIKALAQAFQIARVHFQAAVDALGHAAMFASCGLHHAVGSNAAYEMRAQVSKKIGVTLVSEGLRRTNDSRSIHVIVSRQFPGREKICVLRVVKNLPQQSPPAGVQIRARFGQTLLQWRGRRTVTRSRYALAGSVLVHMAHSAQEVGGTAL